MEKHYNTMSDILIPTYGGGIIPGVHFPDIPIVTILELWQLLFTEDEVRTLPNR